MPRHVRFHRDENVYHVIIRCNNKQMFLKPEWVKLLLLESFGRYQERLGFKVYAYVVMDNHLHILLQSQGMNSLSVVMQKVLLSFSHRYRERNKYVGHFWQGRYKSVAVITDIGMREVLGYIHDNPVKAGLVKDAGEYVYSSLYAYAQQSNRKVEPLIKVTKYGDTSCESLELLKL